MEEVSVCYGYYNKFTGNYRNFVGLNPFFETNENVT